MMQLDSLIQSIDTLIAMSPQLSSENEGKFNKTVESLSSPLKDAKKKFRAQKISPKEYSQICEKLKELDESLNQEHETIHRLWIKAVRHQSEKTLSTSSEEEVRSHSPHSYLKMGYEGVKWLPRKFLSYFNDLFIDGNHPWKQLKYQFVLNCIYNTFEQNGISLENISSELEICDELHQLTLSVIENLFPTNDHTVNMREKHSRFRSYLREAITSERFTQELKKKDLGEKYDPCIDLLLNICTYRYTEVQLYSFCKEVVEEVIRAGAQEINDNPSLDVHKLPLEEQFRAINLSPQNLKSPITHQLIDQAQGALNLNFDPLQNGNTPFVMYDINIPQRENSDKPTKKVRAFRTGTPTSQRTTYETLTISGKATIIPEFLMFLKGLHFHNKKLLFISLQDDTDRYVANEKQRNVALERLSHDFPNTFIFVIFAQDTPFYYQTDNYAEDSNATSFKNTCFHEFVDSQNKGFFIPQQWKEHEMFRTTVLNIINEIHEDIFFSNDELSLEERYDFIEYVLARLTLFFLTYSSADYFCLCCKHSADRTGKNHAILMKLVQILTGTEEEEESVQQLNVYTHAPALIANKREMNGRRRRLITALNRLGNYIIKEKLRQRSKSIGVTGKLFIVENKDQHMVNPLPIVVSDDVSSD